jgi:hypothetical protein
VPIDHGEHEGHRETGKLKLEIANAKLGARGWGLGQFQTLNSELLSSFSPLPTALRLRTAALALYWGSPAICCFKAPEMEASEPNSF